MTDAIPVPTFERHNRCLTCGYDLFSQPRSGNCPECGTSTRESARQDAFLARPGSVARLRSGTTLLLWSSILAGLCPAICCLAVATDTPVLLSMAMTVVFAATATTAALGEKSLASLGESREINDGAVNDPRVNVAADLIAGAGLVLITLAAHLYSFNSSPYAKHGVEMVVGGLVTLGFCCLAVTAWRAVPAYWMRAKVADACFGGNHRGLMTLGYVKAIYETVWLCCCWLPIALMSVGVEDVAAFIAFGALFGLGGFAIVWVVTIVMHAILFVKVRRRFGEPNRGFEVVSLASVSQE